MMRPSAYDVVAPAAHAVAHDDFLVALLLQRARGNAGGRTYESGIADVGAPVVEDGRRAARNDGPCRGGSAGVSVERTLLRGKALARGQVTFVVRADRPVDDRPVVGPGGRAGEARTQAALTYVILNTAPALPSTLRPELPPLLDKIVMNAIHKDPVQRYRSWLEFGKDLSQAFGALRVSGDGPSDSAKFNELRQMAFFEDFGDVALWEVVRIGAWKKFAAGTAVVREGEQGESFYLLVSGTVGVTLSGKTLDTLKRGGCFGQILYFNDRVERRTTTITALGDITVIEIKVAALRAATDACLVACNKAFMRVLVDRLMHANMQLAARG
jgi:hypothetical protein